MVSKGFLGFDPGKPYTYLAKAIGKRLGGGDEVASGAFIDDVSVLTLRNLAICKLF